ncbi:uncharacterized protein LOC101860564 [Aplysia californica]|uniref:Uncharacterized protein LOC101860564 n=1 Tax=Aplysia californica TaxID=6500 RepID=A0ABM0JLZ6_APLCA|nr:uncharacterized protein LOC101860564 [Aplysia californica]
MSSTVHSQVAEAGSAFPHHTSLCDVTATCSCSLSSRTALLPSRCCSEFKSSQSSSSFLSSSASSSPHRDSISPLTTVPCLPDTQDSHVPSSPSPSPSSFSSSPSSSSICFWSRYQTCAKDTAGSPRPSISDMSMYSPRSLLSPVRWARCPPLSLVSVLLVLCVFLCGPASIEARSVGVCLGVPCANGGQLLVSNSVWGDCRCRCRAGFVGPFCQYQAAHKRSAATSQPVQVGRLEEMVEIHQRLLALQRRLDEDSQDTRHVTRALTNESGRMTGSVGGEESSLDSFSSGQNRPRRSWEPRLEFRHLLKRLAQQAV